MSQSANPDREIHPKLHALAKVERTEVGHMLGLAAFGGVVMGCSVPGICLNDDCNWVDQVPPQATNIYCPKCETKSVCSCVKLALGEQHGEAKEFKPCRDD